MNTPGNKPAADFDHLTPEYAIELVEAALGSRCTNHYRQLNSYINRVYSLEREAGGPVIAKFYRPGRWTREALGEEHAFLAELHEAEIPVIPPLRGQDGSTLFSAGDMFFSLFEKKGGRICEEPDPEQWRTLGRLIARVHMIGASRPAPHRVIMSPDAVTLDHLHAIMDSGLVAPEYEDAYEDAALDIIELITPLFGRDAFLRIHGDCHRQNIIHRPGEGFYMIDFDDMAMGPAVQDLWMLLPGRVQDARREVDLLLEGYELFRPFHEVELRLVEPLRAMRFIHFTAWCVRQAADSGFARLVPHWGSPSYWRQEIQELQKQIVEIEDSGALD